MERFHWRLPFQERVASAKAGDDGRLQRSAEPSIVLVQGGHVREAAVLKTGAMRSRHLATHEGKRDATRAWSARRDTYPPPRSRVRAIRPRARPLSEQADRCVDRALLRDQAHRELSTCRLPEIASCALDDLSLGGMIGCPRYQQPGFKAAVKTSSLAEAGHTM